MEDMIVKKGYYAYMLRVDCPSTHDEQKYKDFDDTLKHLKEWGDRYDLVYYIAGQEYSNTGKPHLQAIVWFEKLVDKNKLRNWWKTRSANTKQSVAFTSAKKIKSLAKYSMKDKNYVTNLHIDEISKIGKWETAKKLRELWTDQLSAYAQQIAEQYNKCDYTDTYVNSANQLKQYDFIDDILLFYRKHNKRPHKSTIEHLLWKCKIITNTQWIDKHKIVY